MGRDLLGRVALVAVALAAVGAASPALSQVSAVSVAEGVHAGEVVVPINKSQVIRSDRPYAKALIGSPDIADVLPLTDSSLYVLGVVHTLGAGSDAREPWLLALLLVTGTPILYLGILRALPAAPPVSPSGARAGSG